MEAFRQLVVITFVLILCCTNLRNSQEIPKPRTKATTTTLNYQEYLLMEKSRLLYFEYYPNYGYEPYWADGEGVLSTTKAEGTTTKKLKVCGEECTYLFRRIHHVCARLSNDTSGQNCTAYKKCTGKYGDNYNPAYKTFDTYCEFLDAQCKAKFYDISRWVLVSVGKCKQLEDYFKPMWEGAEPISRMAFYLSSLMPSTSSSESRI